MLEEKDLAAIAQLMANQETRILEKMDARMGQQKMDILGEMTQQNTDIFSEIAQQKTEIFSEMAQQKTEILGEMAQQKEEILEQSAANMRVLLENYVAPQFNLLNEKMDAMAEKLAPMEAVQDHDDRLDDLENVVRRHTREIEALKKAQ